MRRNLLFLALAVTALVSCSKDEIKEENLGAPISFRPAMETRMSEFSNSNLPPYLYVSAKDDYGKLYFNQIQFRLENGVYVTDTPLYWPRGYYSNGQLEGAGLSFYVYGPNKYSDWYSDANPSAPYILKNYGIGNAMSVTPSYFTSQTDFVAAGTPRYFNVNETTNCPGGVVPLDLKHQLAQVEFRAKSTNPNYEIIVSDVRLVNVVMSCNFSLTDLSDRNGGTDWANQGDPWMVNDATKTLFTWYYSSNNDPALEPDIESDGVCWNLMDGKKLSESTSESAVVTSYNFGMIPQQFTPWKPEEDLTNSKGGSYVALSVKVLRYSHESDDTTIDYYPNSTAYYGRGWIAIPLPEMKIEAGKKYVFTVDFTNGIGYVDPGYVTIHNQYGTIPDGFEAGQKLSVNTIGFNVDISTQVIDDWNTNDAGSEDVPM